MMRALLFLLLMPSFLCHAFNEPVDHAGAFTARINGPAEISAVETPTEWELELVNDGILPVSGTLHIEVIDAWRLDGKPEQPFVVPAGKTLSVPFTATAGRGTYNAWYPIHARAAFDQDGVAHEAHPILLVRANITDVPRPESQLAWAPMPVPEQGRRSLAGLPVHRVVVAPFEGEPILLPPGWRGTEPVTKSVVQTLGAQALPESRRAVFAHPPWYGGFPGALFLEIPLTLPDAAPLRFECALAVQEHMSSEPPSDGVTFRVYVAPLDAAPGALGELLFEKHTDSKTWEPVSADLTAYAGKEVVLQLETHPGPKRDTTCDRALWGDPGIVAGEAVTPADAPAREPVALGMLLDGKFVYDVRVTPGRRGLLDGRVAFATGLEELSFDGFAVTVLGDALEALDGTCALVGVDDESAADTLRLRHRFESVAGAFDLVGELRIIDGKALRAGFHLENAPEPKPWSHTVIEDAAPRRWSHRAWQLYAGMGNVIRTPEAFRLHFDGHQLSTSFVGFDFENGISLVVAADAPPSQLVVAPDTHTYALHSPIQPVFTFIPARDVWRGARVWRDINGLEAAPGVERLAGRFVFDLWGGRYGDSADALEQAFRYGLTNSAVVWHNWQRWGYDYRLPDIWPPNPQYGTLEEFQRLAALCREHDVIFAPHDNYIDFYPDAEGFSYERIGFNNDGHPIWAWFNEGRKAQAFRWNVEAMRPFLERNLALIRDGIHPNGFFIDVWSSIGPYEAWTHDGRLQDRLLHKQIWGERFAWIREFLGDNAPQISESGHDQLIGRLDGAQTNHLRVDPAPPGGTPQWMTWPVRCEAAERIPWSDMAHHDRFILHGAGYDSRYRGGLRADLHGIYSDDYICTEVLTGHPAMADAPFHRDVVRKYWLTDDIMSHLARKRIRMVDFDGDDIHRQHVRWENAGNAWVNRGESDWQIAGRILPQYGYYADLGEVSGAIERKDGMIVEWSKSPYTWYVNARPVVARGVPASVRLATLRLTEGRAFEVTLAWEVFGAIEEDLVVYVHFMDDKGDILFQADGRPQPPTNEWQDAAVTTGRGVVPANLKPGDVVELQAGLWKPGDRRRPLQNNVHGDASVRLARVQLEGDSGALTGFAIAPIPSEQDEWLARMNPDGRMVDFDGVITDGACRIKREDNGWTVTPLPDSPAFTVRFTVPNNRETYMPAPTHLEAISHTGKRNIIPFVKQDHYIVIKCEPDVFAYRVE